MMRRKSYFRSCESTQTTLPYQYLNQTTPTETESKKILVNKCLLLKLSLWTGLVIEMKNFIIRP